jgi:imidazolonepropionase-like amidohydrolase
VIIRAARHLARPKRYIRDLGLELDDPALLPGQVAAQAAAGDGWVKLVGDWIDRGVGDLAPLWPDDVLAEAIAVAHGAGARVTAHVFGTDALPGLINAGIDCIEHGTGLTDDLIALMADRGTALVPTLINVETFPGIADAASKFPLYADHMRELHAHAYDVVRRAAEAGVAVYAGTDAGGTILHGRIADEVAALHDAGMSATAALGAASWDARSWLGHPGLTPGERADLVVYADDPRQDVRVLRSPELVVLRGRPVRRAH